MCERGYAPTGKSMTRAGAPSRRLLCQAIKQQTCGLPILRIIAWRSDAPHTAQAEPAECPLEFTAMGAQPECQRHRRLSRRRAHTLASTTTSPMLFKHGSGETHNPICPMGSPSMVLAIMWPYMVPIESCKIPKDNSLVSGTTSAHTVLVVFPVRRPPALTPTPLSIPIAASSKSGLHLVVCFWCLAPVLGVCTQ